MTEEMMPTSLRVPAHDLQPGDRVRYLGEVRVVREVRESLGNGYDVTFSNGLSANFVGSVETVVYVPPSSL